MDREEIKKVTHKIKSNCLDCSLCTLMGGERCIISRNPKYWVLNNYNGEYKKCLSVYNSDLTRSCHRSKTYRHVVPFILSRGHRPAPRPYFGHRSRERIERCRRCSLYTPILKNSIPSASLKLCAVCHGQRHTYRPA